jgi:outer membrane protein assembly factor BamB
LSRILTGLLLAAPAWAQQPLLGENPYPGEFSAAPAFHFRVKLPGAPLNAASHSEWGAPVLAGERVLVGSAAGQGLYAMSRRDGRVLEIYEADASVEASPHVAGDQVFFSDTGGNTYCYRLDGELVWKHDGNAPVLVAPVLADTGEGAVVIVTNIDDLAVALDSKTGELAWQYRAKRDLTRQAELSLFAAPRAVVVGEIVLLGFSSGSLVAVDLETGEEQWKRSVGEGRYPDLVADPVPMGADVFAGGYFLPLVAIDLATRNVRWRLDVGAARPPLVMPREGAETQSLSDAVLYHPGSDGTLRAVATLTGAQLWSWDSGTTGALTTPISTPVGLLVGSSEGGIYLVGTDGREVWRWHEMYLLRGLSAEPAVDGRQAMFVTNAGYLYSLLVPPPQPPPERVWP